MLQYLVRDSLTIPSRIDRDPTTRLTTQVLEHGAHAGLQCLLLVALFAVATPRGGLLRREIEEEDEVRRGEADVGRAAPREREAAVALGGREGHAREGVPVAEHECATG